MVPPTATPFRGAVREQRLNPHPLRISQRHTRTNDQLIQTKLPSGLSPLVYVIALRPPMTTAFTESVNGLEERI